MADVPPGNKRIFAIEFIVKDDPMIKALDNVQQNIGKMDNSLRTLRKDVQTAGRGVIGAMGGMAGATRQAQSSIGSDLTLMTGAYLWLRKVVGGVVESAYDLQTAIAKTSDVFARASASAESYAAAMTAAGRSAATFIDSVAELAVVGVKGERNLKAFSMEIFQFSLATKVSREESGKLAKALVVGFGSSAEQARKQMGGLAAAARSYKLDVSALIQGVREYGAAMKQTGMQLTGFTGIVIGLRKAGLDSAEAVRITGTVLERLRDPTKAAELGLRGMAREQVLAAFRAGDLARGVNLIMRGLKSLGDQSEATKVKVLGLASERELTAFQNLGKHLGQMPGLVQDLGKTFADSSALQREAARGSLNLITQLKLLGEEVKQLGVRIGMFLGPILMPFVMLLRGVVAVLRLIPAPVTGLIGAVAVLGVTILGGLVILGRMITMFQGFRQNVLIAIGALEKLVGAQIAENIAGEAGIVIRLKQIALSARQTIANYAQAASQWVLSGGIWAATSAMWAFTAAVLANPWTWVVVGVAAIVVGLYKLWKMLASGERGIRSLAEAFLVFNPPLLAVVALVKLLVGFFSRLWQAVSFVGEGISKALEGVFGPLEKLPSILGMIDEFLDRLFGTNEAEVFRGKMIAIGEAIGKIVRPILGVLVPVIKTLYFASMAFVAGFLDALEGVWSAFSELGSALGEAFGPLFRVLGRLLSGTEKAGDNVEGLAKIMRVVGIAAKYLFTGLLLPVRILAWGITLVVRSLKMLGDFIAYILSPTTEHAEKLRESFMKWFNMGAFIENAAKKIAGVIWSVAKWWFKQVTLGVLKLVWWIVTVIPRALVKMMVLVATSIWNGINSWARSLVDTLWNMVSKIGDWILTIGQRFKAGIRDMIKDAVKHLGVLGKMFSWIAGEAKGSKKAMHGSGFLHIPEGAAEATRSMLSLTGSFERLKHAALATAAAVAAPVAPILPTGTLGGQLPAPQVAVARAESLIPSIVTRHLPAAAPSPAPAGVETRGDIIIPVTVTMDGEEVGTAIARVSREELLRHGNAPASAMRGIPL